MEPAGPFRRHDGGLPGVPAVRRRGCGCSASGSPTRTSAGGWRCGGPSSAPALLMLLAPGPGGRLRRPRPARPAHRHGGRQGEVTCRDEWGPKGPARNNSAARLRPGTAPGAVRSGRIAMYSPDSIANTTSWARSRAPSLTIARLTWVRTVAGLTTSAAAISSLDSPVPTQATISRSRSVSSASRGCGSCGAAGSGREVLDHPPGHRRRQQRAAGGDHPDRAQQLGRFGVLEQEAAGPGAQRREHVLVQLERGQHDHPDAGQRRVGADPAGRLEAVQPGIRMSISTTSGGSARTSASACAPSAASPTSSMSVLGVEQRAQPHPDQRLVVDDGHADHAGPPGSGSCAATRKPPSARAGLRARRPAHAARSRMPCMPARAGAAPAARGRRRRPRPPGRRA